MTLTEFLLARIAEDEEEARAPGLAGVAPLASLVPVDVDDDIRVLAVDPARVLAECEAKRRIVARSSYADDTRPTYNAMRFEPGDGIATDNLRDLALPYADHADYRAEWRP